MEPNICPEYKPDKVDGCEHLRISNYESGTSRYCRKFDKELYYLKDKNCPQRPTYSNELDEQPETPELDEGEWDNPLTDDLYEEEDEEEDEEG